MNRRLSTPLLLVVSLAAARAQSPIDRAYLLDRSTLTYHMSHPIHEVDGVTHAAKGKGVCHAGVCDFLLAVPVKSFDSGDSNRDLHMQQVTRAAQNPLVTVRFRLPQATIDAPAFECDLEVQFAGNTAHYTHVLFRQEINGTERHITGVVPSTVRDFKIDPPSFLTVPIKNDIPVRVDTTWRPQ